MCEGPAFHGCVANPGHLGTVKPLTAVDEPDTTGYGRSKGDSRFEVVGSLRGQEPSRRRQTQAPQPVLDWEQRWGWGGMGAGEVWVGVRGNLPRVRWVEMLHKHNQSTSP